MSVMFLSGTSRCMASDSKPLIPRWAAGLWSHSACQVHFTYPLMITGLSLGTDMLSTPSDHERAVPVLRAILLGP